MMMKRKTAIEKMTPAMLRYLREVIDTSCYGPGLDAEIGRRVGLSTAWGNTLKHKIARRLTREELLEVCDIIMKEAA